MSDSIYSFWFLSEKIIPTSSKKKAYEYFGDAYHIFFASESDIYRSNTIQKEKIYDFLKERSKFDLEKEYEKFLQGPFSFVTLEDDRYPRMLRMAKDCPYGFYINGQLPSNESRYIAMVGARNCSAYGKTVAMELGAALSKQGFVVVSGMALGIDTYAHEGAIRGGGNTIAVLGCGVDVIYPRSNSDLYKRIRNQGCVISEFPISEPARPAQFPQRNRIISGLCEATIVVEAKLKSGSLITADCALEQNRDVYAIPGRLGDSLSSGCNRLINQGAGIITSIDQFITDLCELSGEASYSIKSELDRNVDITKSEALVLATIDYYPRDISSILMESQIPFLEAIKVLSSLQEKGLIKEVFKNQYVLLGGSF